MIKIQLKELRSIVDGLNEILEKELPIKPAYWFGKLAKKAGKEMTDLEEARMKLVKKYAEPDEKGQPKVNEETRQYVIADQDGFAREFNELLNTEIEIDFTPISIDALGDAKISPVVMMGLEKFVGE